RWIFDGYKRQTCLEHGALEQLQDVENRKLAASVLAVSDGRSVMQDDVSMSKARVRQGDAFDPRPDRIDADGPDDFCAAVRVQSNGRDAEIHLDRTACPVEPDPVLLPLLSRHFPVPQSRRGDGEIPSCRFVLWIQLVRLLIELEGLFPLSSIFVDEADVVIALRLLGIAGDGLQILFDGLGGLPFVRELLPFRVKPGGFFLVEIKDFQFSILHCHLGDWPGPGMRDLTAKAARSPTPHPPPPPAGNADGRAGGRGGPARIRSLRGRPGSRPRSRGGADRLRSARRSPGWLVRAHRGRRSRSSAARSRRRSSRRGGGCGSRRRTPRARSSPPSLPPAPAGRGPASRRPAPRAGSRRAPALSGCRSWYRRRGLARRIP